MNGFQRKLTEDDVQKTMLFNTNNIKLILTTPIIKFNTLLIGKNKQNNTFVFNRQF